MKKGNTVLKKKKKPNADSNEYSSKPRSVEEICELREKFCDLVWYNRHHGLLYRIQKGKLKICDMNSGSCGKECDYNKNICADIYKSACKSAKEVEKKYPGECGPWDDFEWGMVNGKLSALRWVLGDEWDFLDT